MKNNTQSSEPNAYDYLESLHIFYALCSAYRNKIHTQPIIIERSLFSIKPHLFFTLKSVSDKPKSKKTTTYPLHQELAIMLNITPSKAKELERWIFKPFLQTLQKHTNAYLALEHIKQTLSEHDAIDPNHTGAICLWSQKPVDYTFLIENERFNKHFLTLYENGFLGSVLEKNLQPSYERAKLDKELPDSTTTLNIEPKSLRL